MIRRPPRCTLFPRTTIFLFFFNDTATTEIYTLSLHDALPISNRQCPECTRHPHGPGRPLARIIGEERVGTRIRALSRLDQGDRKMLATTGTLLCGLGVLSVALEATWPAAAFGAVGMWMISHAA